MPLKYFTPTLDKEPIKIPLLGIVTLILYIDKKEENA